MRNGILAFVLALVAGVGLAFLRDALDTRLRSADDISGRLELRLLARLPRPPRALRRRDRLVMLADPDSPYAEPFRMLKTSLEFVMLREAAERRQGATALPKRSASLHGSQRGYRAMITSSVEGEGKSTTVANLAVAFARAGRRVVLVDLDLRRSSIHRFFGLSGKQGLTDVVLGSAPLDAVVADIGITPGDRIERSIGRLSEGSLRVLPLGTSPRQAAELTFTAGIEHVLSELDADADLILIDAPPLLRVGDALALTSYVDGLLVVASLRTIRAPMVDELRRLLEASRVAKLGFILTGADLEPGYGYLGHHYHHRAQNVS